MADAIDVGCFSDRQALVIEQVVPFHHCSPPDVISHNKEDVELVRRSRCRHLLLRDRRSSRYNRSHADGEEHQQVGAAWSKNDISFSA